MGKRNRRARRNPKKGKLERLIDEPAATRQTHEAEDYKAALSCAGDIPLSRTPASTRQSQTQDSSNAAQSSGYIVRPLITIGRSFKGLFSFVDRHDGSVTAAATVAIVFLTFFYVSYSKRQWQAMGEDDRIASNFQRPWVGLDDDTRALQTSSITFDKRADASITFHVIAKNFGVYLASGVAPLADLVITDDYEAVQRKQASLCSELMDPLHYGQILFPGKFKITGSDISRWKRVNMISKAPDGLVQAWMAGCIDYRDNSGGYHNTGFIFHLTDKNARPLRFMPQPNAKLDGAWNIFDSFAN